MKERTLPPTAHRDSAPVHSTDVQAEDGLIPRFRLLNLCPSPGPGSPDVLGSSRHGLVLGNPGPADHHWQSNSVCGHPSAAGIGLLRWKEKALCLFVESISMMVHAGQSKGSRDGWTRSGVRVLVDQNRSSRSAHSMCQLTPPRIRPRQERRRSELRCAVRPCVWQSSPGLKRQ